MRVRLLTSAMLIGGSLAFASLPAVAQQKGGHSHDGHKHEHPTAKFGGVLEDVGEYHVEMVAKDGKIALYLRTEDAKDSPADGFKASVLITSGSQRVGPIDVKPAGGNKMEGAAASIPAGSTAIVTLTNKAGTAAQGRFKLP